MKQQPRVETVEDFKLRIAAIIRGKPEHIPGAPRPNPLLVRHKKRGSPEKHNVVRQRIRAPLQSPSPQRFSHG
jgi:hypothetical protein